MISDVFCDDLRVSMGSDSWAELRESLESVLADAGYLPEYETASAVQWRNEGGTIRSEFKYRVRTLSFSGASLAGLRLAKLLGTALATVGTVPHRVTGLHATVDVQEATPPVLERVANQARAEKGLRAGRKRIPVTALEYNLRDRGDGVRTGTVYCGGRGTEIRPVVYDKRMERLEKGGMDIGHDLTRYELRLRNVGATLRDAYEPAAIFWHYMAPDFLPAPPGAPAWVPGAMGYVIDHPAPLLPAVRLQRAVEGSQAFAALVRQAAAFPAGVEFLCALVRRGAAKETESEGVQGMPPALTDPAAIFEPPSALTVH